MDEEWEDQAPCHICGNAVNDDDYHTYGYCGRCSCDLRNALLGDINVTVRSACYADGYYFVGDSNGNIHCSVDGGQNWIVVQNLEVPSTSDDDINTLRFDVNTYKIIATCNQEQIWLPGKTFQRS